jgi:hypothetical protein
MKRKKGCPARRYDKCWNREFWEDELSQDLVWEAIEAYEWTEGTRVSPEGMRAAVERVVTLLSQAPVELKRDERPDGNVVVYGPAHYDDALSLRESLGLQPHNAGTAHAATTKEAFPHNDSVWGPIAPEAKPPVVESLLTKAYKRWLAGRSSK